MAKRNHPIAKVALRQVFVSVRAAVPGGSTLIALRQPEAALVHLPEYHVLPPMDVRFNSTDDLPASYYVLSDLTRVDPSAYLSGYLTLFRRLPSTGDHIDWVILFHPDGTLH